MTSVSQQSHTESNQLFNQQVVVDGLCEAHQSVVNSINKQLQRSCWCPP